MHLSLLVLLTLAQPPQSNFTFEEKGNYIGNVISPVFTFQMKSDKAKTWRYTYVDNMSGTLKNPVTNVTEGTWEVDGDLVIFTGKTTPKDEGDGEVKFALNWGLIGGKVEFNRLFPADDGTMKYHRKWFKKTANGWQPTREIVIVMMDTKPPKDAKTWKVRYRMDCTTWTDAGDPKTERVEMAPTYKNSKPGWYVDDDGSVRKSGLPEVLAPIDGKQGLAGFVTSIPGIGWLRGFHPLLARPDW